MNKEQLNLELSPGADYEQMSAFDRNQLFQVYSSAFGEPPYNEQFSEDEVSEILSDISQNGELTIGRLEGNIVSLAGGRIDEESGFFIIEELAVDPDMQGQGFGRETLDQMLSTVREDTPAIAVELRTTEGNEKAKSLYESVGFIPQPFGEIVAQRRGDGSIRLDQRDYLFLPLREGVMQENNKLKRVAIAWPNGNATAVVFDQRLDTDRKDLNTRIMETWKTEFSDMEEIEQCCFVTKPKNTESIARVEMFGGEFCGNATRSVIQLITKGEDYSGQIEVSGVEEPLNFRVSSGDISVEMPILDSNMVTQVEEGQLVQLDGIAQLVVTDKSTQEGYDIEDMMRDIIDQNRYNLAVQPAVGISFYDKDTNTAQFRVWVRDVDTIFDETACGSGTCACGVAIAETQKNNIEIDVIQPSGETIQTSARYDKDKGRVVYSEITGSVDIRYDGSLTLLTDE